MSLLSRNTWQLAALRRGYSYIHRPKPKEPHILGPSHIWRKCYLVHTNKNIYDPVPSFQWLTKSALIDGLPDCLANRELFSQNVIDDFRLRATEVLAKQEQRRSYKGNIIYLDVTRSFLQGVLPALWNLGKEHAHLDNCSVAYQPHIETFWMRHGFKFVCKTSPSYLLHTAYALPLLHEDVSFKGNDSIPTNQYHPRHLYLFEHSFNELRPFCGYRLGSSYTFCHTLLITDTFNNDREHHISNGLLSLFAQASAQTLQYGYKQNKDLYFPLTSQAIITNGRTFTFLCFQLNTLDMREDLGAWNICWAGPTLPLYDRIEDGELVGFNEECVQLLLQVLTNPPGRHKPIYTGFKLAYIEQLKRKQKWDKKAKKIYESFKEKAEARGNIPFKL